METRMGERNETLQAGGVMEKEETEEDRTGIRDRLAKLLKQKVK